MFAFAITLGLGMAILAFVGFLTSLAKTKMIGPDPQFDFIEDEHRDEIDDQ